MGTSNSARTSRDLVLAYVRLHNAGVTTGEFGGFAAILHPEAELRFLRLPYGPFEGIDAIDKAFKESPPSDTLILISLRQVAGRAEATYAWSGNPHVAAGVIRIREENGLIRELTIQ